MLKNWWVGCWVLLSFPHLLATGSTPAVGSSSTTTLDSPTKASPTQTRLRRPSDSDRTGTSEMEGESIAMEDSREEEEESCGRWRLDAI